MSVQPLNQKSLKVIQSKGFLTVLEGAVRSTKTVTSLVAWYRYILNSPENVFLMSGNTLGSISRNCIYGDFGFIAITGYKAIPKTDTDGSKFLQLGNKKIYYCGADNAASFKKIRGLSIGGWYADEINLHNKDFIETAFARSFASTDRQNFWTLNPDIPGHWIYSEYIDKYQKEQTPGYNYFHFVLDDNPSLTEERKAEIKAQFSGVFYKRYVLGLRVRAEGGCYPSFSENNIIDDFDKTKILYVQIGVDIGGNKSATVFTATGFFMKDKKLNMVVLDEYYDSENKSTESVLNAYKFFVKKIKEEYICADVYCESAEQLIKKSISNLGMVNVHNSLKKPIVDRIRITDLLFSLNRLLILKKCSKLITSINSAVWNDKSTEEIRLDDGTYNVDSLDSFEYSFESKMRDFI